MVIHNIKITNFKSIYTTQYFDFDSLNGLVKLSGPIGAGKTSIGEAILYGLFGSVRDQNNSSLIAWNTKDCEVELNLTAKGKNIHIIRGVCKPLIVEIDGKALSASNKRNAQTILEDELLDVPRIAIERMCIISFSQFNSLANMNPGQTKQFLDDVFGFKLFTDYNEHIVVAKKNEMNESVKLAALYEEYINQIKQLEDKKAAQKRELASNIDLIKYAEDRKRLVEEGKALKEERAAKDEEYKATDVEIYRKITELTTLGKQEKKYYMTFKNGVCPTCGNPIDPTKINDCKKKMDGYAEEIRILTASREELHDKFTPMIDDLTKKMMEKKDAINAIDNDIKMYNNNVQLISENYDSLIEDYTAKAAEVKEKLDRCDIEIGEWNEMNELFTKTLRYKLLDTLIPHINKSIQYFIDKLDQNYKVEYDQEFKPHIYTDIYDKEISYNNLSTGQKKTLDMAIIFGILKNIISNIDCNVILLDELFSNMDVDTRNVMLSVLKESFDGNKTVFVINHAEMNDDYFKHKIKVALTNKKVYTGRGTDEANSTIVKSSKYEQIF